MNCGISIHVPTRGTTSADHDADRADDYFNPRAYTRHDYVMRAVLDEFANFNPRAYTRHDRVLVKSISPPSYFNPRAYTRHDDTPVFLVLGRRNFNPRAYTRHDSGMAPQDHAGNQFQSTCLHEARQLLFSVLKNRAVSPSRARTSLNRFSSAALLNKNAPPCRVAVASRTSWGFSVHLCFAIASSFLIYKTCPHIDILLLFSRKVAKILPGYPGISQNGTGKLSVLQEIRCNGYGKQIGGTAGADVFSEAERV